MTREEFLTHFRITDSNLNQLVMDLVAQPDTPNNRVLIHKAIRGTYTIGSALNNVKSFFAHPIRSQGGADNAEKELVDHLTSAQKTEPYYDYLLEQAKAGAYRSTVTPEVISPEVVSQVDHHDFIEAATVPQPTRVSREKMLSHYYSEEKGYNLLVKDLMKLPATEENYRLLDRLVAGEYSDYHGSCAPVLQLGLDLGFAAVNSPAYEALRLKAYKDEYEHEYAPLKDGEAQYSTVKEDILSSALQWIKKDMQKGNQSMEEGPMEEGPSFF